jgi:hypothetical protein
MTRHRADHGKEQAMSEQAMTEATTKVPFDFDRGHGQALHVL